MLLFTKWRSISILTVYKFVLANNKMNKQDLTEYNNDKSGLGIGVSSCVSCGHFVSISLVSDAAAATVNDGCLLRVIGH